MLSTNRHRDIKTWAETRLGVSLESAARDSAPVIGGMNPSLTNAGLAAVRLAGLSLIAARDKWVDLLRELTSDIHPDLLFTVFGAYELSRVTLPDAASVWGPNWYMFSDRQSWRGIRDERVQILRQQDLENVDFDTFWHCFGVDSLAAFGVSNGSRLVALATVKDVGSPFMEIGVDVVRNGQLSGLGSAVVSAAGSWILDQGALPMATVAPFNVPSTRTLRRAGLEYGMTEMTAVKGPFRVPPQAMGTPVPGAEIFDYYPRWAMNPDIRPRSEP